MRRGIFQSMSTSAECRATGSWSASSVCRPEASEGPGRMFLLLLFALVGAHVGDLQQTAASAPEVRFPLRIVTVDVLPPNPRPETLCRLRVTLRNSGSGTVADVKFEVKVN